MAGISQKVSADEVMPLLARNVFIIGYQGTGATSQATEFLILLRRYVQQATELAAYAGTAGVIRRNQLQRREGLAGDPGLPDTSGLRKEQHLRGDCGCAQSISYH